VVTGKLTLGTFEVEGAKWTMIEVQASHVGDDLQFASATIEKATKEKQSA
jgi:hypothetical protein